MLAAVALSWRPVRFEAGAKEDGTPRRNRLVHFNLKVGAWLHASVLRLTAELRGLRSWLLLLGAEVDHQHLLPLGVARPAESVVVGVAEVYLV